MGVTISAKGTAALLAVVLGGCPTPAQEGGLLRVDNEGFARRLQMVCSSGHADPSCPSPADASVVEDAGEAPSDAPGPE
jgi:hypothetical protein